MRFTYLFAAFLFVTTVTADAEEEPPPSRADEVYQAAENLLATGRYLEAAESYASFCERFTKDPRVPEASLRQGESLFLAASASPLIEKRRELYGKAIESFSRLKKDSRAVYRTGNILFLLGDFEEASKWLRDLVSRKHVPKALLGAGNYFLARSLLTLGKVEDARRSLSEANKLLTGVSAAYSQLALGDLEAAAYHPGLKNNEQYDAALSAYRNTLQKSTEGRLVPETLFRIGELMRRAGKYEDARRHYLRAVKQHATSPVVPYAELGAAWASLGLRDTKAALSHSRSARKGVRDRWLLEETRYVEGAALVAEKRFGEATQALAPFIDRTDLPWSGFALRRLAWSALAAGKYDIATRSTEKLKARELTKEQAAEVDFIAAEVALNTGAAPEALKLYDAVIKTKGPTAILASYRRASALTAGGDAQKAALAFDEFAKKHPKHALSASAVSLAARSYLTAGAGDKAAERFSQARKDPRNKRHEHELLWAASITEYMRGNFDAMAEFDKEMLSKHKNSPRAPDAAYWLAWSHLQKSDWGKAARLFRDSAVLARKSSKKLAAVSLLESAAALERDGNREAALKTATELVSGELAGEAPVAVALWTAQALQDAGRKDDARKILDKARQRVANSSDKARLLYALGEITRESKEYDKAIKLFDQALASKPRTDLAAAARIGKGRCLAATGKRSQAVAVLENVAKRNSGRGHAAAYVELGLLRLDWAAQSQGNRRNELASEAAEDFMLVALLYEPDGPGDGAELCARALLGAARAYAILKKENTAIDRLEQMLRHPLYGTLPEAKKARKLLQQMRLPANRDGAPR